MTLGLRVCVYCGSRPGANPAFMRSARQMGTAIGRRGWQLVYGGGRVGLMGALADAALAAGGTVEGVIPQSLMQREAGHRGLTRLRVVDTMHERKRLMAEHCYAFIALPGGVGTFEELFEIWSWRHLGYHDRPLGLLDVAGYFQPLLAMMRQAERDGFVTAEQLAMVTLGDSPDTLLDAIESQAAPGKVAEDLRRI
ncbi:MAG TPA: TIGR00730 family Rossman fold protein [Burkholderiaceae bacterium]|nr:TIGR00730 family Rossman fold protein [Burkholderiaceae bacterium]HSB99284.1 TIGR00730 family Rossman fold protein [Burkholderiaceae bacterium]